MNDDRNDLIAGIKNALAVEAFVVMVIFLSVAVWLNGFAIFGSLQ